MKFLAAATAWLGGGAVLSSAAYALRQPQQPPSKAAVPENNGTVQKRARLDVGFSDFEKKMLAQVSQRIHGTDAGKDWTRDLQERCAGNVTQELSRDLKVQLAPVKQSIGKTWMALPKDEQKNAYVDQLKSAFLPVLDSYSKTIDGHLNISLNRMHGFGAASAKQEPTALLSKCQALLKDSLAGEHCYEDSQKQGKKATRPAKQTAAATQAAPRKLALVQTAEQEEQEEVMREAEQFCIPSILQGLAHRLNDTQGLISMSMRFDAGAMALAQKGARSPASK